MRHVRDVSDTYGVVARTTGCDAARHRRRDGEGTQGVDERGKHAGAACDCRKRKRPCRRRERPRGDVPHRQR
jgi:hypothetical protein